MRAATLATIKPEISCMFFFAHVQLALLLRECSIQQFYSLIPPRKTKQN
jgi:hypothetical protein